MSCPSKSLHRLPRRQNGLTLIELMVSLVISVVIALAAATAYLGSRSTATALSNISNLNESGKLALQAIGREIQTAGYYPVIMSPTNRLPEYTNIKGGAAAYNQGLFGCDGALFDPTTDSCGTPVADAPDSIVINYFAAVELDPNLFSSGFDCLRAAASNDPDNAGRPAASLPVVVSNRFGLSAIQNYTMQGAGKSEVAISTRSFACNGNGEGTASTIYQPMFDGMWDMVIRYGANDGTSMSPTTYRTAAQISALPLVPLVGGLNGWQRVTSVRVCLLTKSLENIRTQDQASALRTYEDCRGNTKTYGIDERVLYKRFEGVFAVRNNLKVVY